MVEKIVLDVLRAGLERVFDISEPEFEEIFNYNRLAADEKATAFLNSLEVSL